VALREHVPEVRQFYVAIFFDQSSDVVAPAPAARLALDRERGDAKVVQREEVSGHHRRSKAGFFTFNQFLQRPLA
jgi:hypothetical protein